MQRSLEDFKKIGFVNPDLNKSDTINTTIVLAKYAGMGHFIVITKRLAEEKYRTDVIGGANGYDSEDNRVKYDTMMREGKWFSLNACWDYLHKRYESFL